MSDPRIEELGDTQCREQLAGRHLGRLALVDAHGPVILPVNYVVDGDAPVFRTDPGAKLDAAAEGTTVAFEVDATDEATRTGRSVVVRGTLGRAPTPRTWNGCRPCPCTRGRRGTRPATCG